MTDTLNFDLSLVKKKKKKKPVLVEGTTETPLVTYSEMLDAIYSKLTVKDVQHKSKFPAPELVRIGAKKSMWSNFQSFYDILHRKPDHLMTFLLNELSIEGSIDSNQHLLFKGLVRQKQIESLLKKYISEYVSCGSCRGLDTDLTKENRLYVIVCRACKASRSVSSIQAGFQATTKSDRKAGRV